MCQLFSPTKFVVTFESNGQGAFSAKEIENAVSAFQSSGRLALPLAQSRLVVTPNHQIYPDWWYFWSFLYFLQEGGLHKDVHIILKKSLKWIPVVGWGMQFFKFIFLSRRWNKDERLLVDALADLMQTTSRTQPFNLLFFPEGTILEAESQVETRKYAEKMAIAYIPTHSLIPRSTGLYCILRALTGQPKEEGLKLLDLTIMYPPPPSSKPTKYDYPSTHHTLKSVFIDGRPPAEIYVHLRIFDVRDLPLEEPAQFDRWLKELW
jgi:1-acyl-sn-glycerol-3-phosphate acyltransferase